MKSILHSWFAGLLVLAIGTPALAGGRDGGSRSGSDVEKLLVGDGIYVHCTTAAGSRSIYVVKDDAGWRMIDSVEESERDWESAPLDPDPQLFSRSHVEMRLLPAQVGRLLDSIGFEQAMSLPSDLRLSAVVPDELRYRIELHREGQVNVFEVQAPRILASPEAYSFPLREPDFAEFEASTRAEVQQMVPSPVTAYLPVIGGIEEFADSQGRIASRNDTAASE